MSDTVETQPVELEYREHACICGRRCWGPDYHVFDTMDMRPMSDYDLEAYDEGARTGHHRFIERPVIRRLVAEVRRLRSDDWLEKAAKEILAETYDAAMGGPPSQSEFLTILRKHRDRA